MKHPNIRENMDHRGDARFVPRGELRQLAHLFWWWVSNATIMRVPRGTEERDVFKQVLHQILKLVGQLFLQFVDQSIARKSWARFTL